MQIRSESLDAMDEGSSSNVQAPTGAVYMLHPNCEIEEVAPSAAV